MLGYAGKILRVNLSDGKISEDKLGEEDARKFLGGGGLAAKILFQELKPGMDPFAPENKLVIMTGPLTGSKLPGTTRFGVFAKSPLTGCWGEANAAGWFAPELKASGYDGLIVEGEAAAPVYLWIKGAEVEIRNAEHLWGRYTLDAERAVREDVKEPKARVACIGPGGEKLVRFACIIHEGHRAAGRTGMGAVMGSKKLKAVAVLGETKPNVADEPGLRELTRLILTRFKDNNDLQELRKHGTNHILSSLNYQGILPTENFRDGAFTGAEEISGEKMTEKILKSRLSCPHCPVACMRVVSVEHGPFAPVLPEYGGPEYETVAAFGSTCLNPNIESIAKANMLCNMFGVDTISTGVSIAFAMECYENKILSAEDTNGLQLEWGDSQAIVKLVELIGSRRGLGDVLAEGVKRAAQQLGRGAERYAIHVKGMEIPMHEPRGKKGVGLSYTTSNRGACHLQTLHDTYFEKKDAYPEVGVTKATHRFATDRRKVEHVIKGEHFWGVLSDSLMVCKFTYPDLVKPADLPEIMHAVTGWDVSIDELMTTAERIFNLCRAFNVREGVTRKDDILPRRFEELPVTGGLARGQTFSSLTLNMMLDDYYELRGWNVKTGIPTKRKLEELQLGYAVEELSKLGNL